MTDVMFEAQHPRGAAGKFAEKRNDAPSGQLSHTDEIAQLTPYNGERVGARTHLPSEPRRDGGMVLGEDQATDVAYFAEEHKLEDGRYLTSVHYTYAAYPDASAVGANGSWRIVTETEQFIHPTAGAYERIAGYDRAGGNRYVAREVELVEASRESAQTRAMQVSQEQWIQQSFYHSGPWAGAPESAEERAELADARQRLGGI